MQIEESPYRKLPGDWERGGKAFWRSFGVLGTTLTEAPEFIKRKAGAATTLK